MAKYLVDVNADQIQSSEQAVRTSLMRCGFTRVVRQGSTSTPLTTLLFQGDSLLDVIQRARHLERKLRLDTLCDVRVIVFELLKLPFRSRANEFLSHTVPRFLSRNLDNGRTH